MASVPSNASFASDATDNRWADTLSGPAVLRALGSLKFTVGLFAISIIIVLVGTLAQDEMNMQEVKERYFLSWIAPLHIDDFFPQAFYRHTEPFRLVVPFPGGAMIGFLLMVNLIAAKVTRFRVQASGGRLIGGLAMLFAGIGVAALVVFFGHNEDGLQGEPLITYNQLWAAMLATMAVSSIALALAANNAKVPILKKLGFITAVALVIAVVAALGTGFRISDPGLRIVWQLSKGLGAGLVMLVGCQMMFGKQGGNVLLHLGVGLLMVGQFAFGDRQMEQRLNLVEGQSTNTFVDLDRVELQLINVKEDREIVTAIPSTRLIAAAGKDQPISDETLPADIRVLEYFENSGLSKPEESTGQSNLADRGIGLDAIAVKKEKSGGANSQMNVPAGYVEFIARDGGQSLGRFLVTMQLNDRAVLTQDGASDDFMDEVIIGDATYKIGLRLHREVKPYWVQLEDVRRVQYSGTETPRDFSSYIKIVEEESGDVRKERVWMNNPLRYRGETFYQSNYFQLPGGKESTGIQVVRNSGWLIPYVACSITGLGMLVHFWGTLTRFISRRRRETAMRDGDYGDFDSPITKGQLVAPEKKSKVETETVLPTAGGRSGSHWPATLWIAAVGLLVVVYLAKETSMRNTVKPAERDTEYDFAALGRLPVQFGGRVMPVDAYARQTLKAMTNKESIPADKIPSEIDDRVDGKSLTAVQWLMEVAIDEPKIRFVPMFRIDADEVLTELGLERRENKLFSINDIGKGLERFSELVREARAKEPIDQTFKDKKLIELDMRTRQFTLAAAAFRLPIPDEIPAELFPEGTSEQTRQLFALRRLEERMTEMAQTPAPAIIPPTKEVVQQSVDQPTWTAFAPAFFEMAANGLSPEQTPPGIRSFGEMLKAYSNEDPAAFNKAVDEHAAAVNEYSIPGYDPFAVSLERWLGAAAPTSIATALYLVAIVLGFIALAIDSPRLNTAVWGTVAIAFIVHTIVVASRVYITGRAPVINLYSSAVFIGWAAVLFGLVVERIFKYGTGNLLAAVAGMMTLRVAYNLTLNVGQAETMGVLQAVLDTQFWLTTHVISVSLGYVATMVAGTLGIGYVIASFFRASDTAKRDLYRVMYGATCFGILFSFIGTVLGGLWADDSWGRFWGWDPKENGALLIVIWNALMLHARWDGMVKGHGFALLAIGGNIVTAWSWFGTNELGIGLHSYGFTEGMKLYLAVFFATQLFAIGAGLLGWYLHKASRLGTGVR